jgi:hypothetical protein
VVVFGVAYGAVMGAYAGPSGPRRLQIVYSATKVPLLLLLTFVISLPSFFVLNTAAPAFAMTSRCTARAVLDAGGPDDHPRVVWRPHGHVVTSRSTRIPPGHPVQRLMFGIASVSAQFLLRRLYRPADRAERETSVAAADVAHGLRVRRDPDGLGAAPFIGHPRGPTTFFREGAWGNAYVEVAGMVRDVVRWRRSLARLRRLRLANHPYHR